MDERTFYGAFAYLLENCIFSTVNCYLVPCQIVPFWLLLHDPTIRVYICLIIVIADHGRILLFLIEGVC